MMDTKALEEMTATDHNILCELKLSARPDQFELLRRVLGLIEQQAQLHNITALLVDNYSESKDWRAGDVVERVRWLKIMFESKKDEVEQQQQQIEQLKCCGNCKHYQQEKELHRTDILYCDIDLSTTNKPWAVCDEWEGLK